MCCFLLWKLTRRKKVVKAFNQTSGWVTDVGTDCVSSWLWYTQSCWSLVILSGFCHCISSMTYWLSSGRSCLRTVLIACPVNTVSRSEQDDTQHRRRCLRTVDGARAVPTAVCVWSRYRTTKIDKSLLPLCFIGLKCSWLMCQFCLWMREGQYDEGK
jgi:hypothetical protein